MKKLLIVCMLCAYLLCGCGAPVEHSESATEDASMFVCVEQTSLWKICYHRETKVMYAVSYGSYNCGTFTLLVNADGTPMLYEGGGEQK